jgi:hypothetical protein
MLTRFFLAMAAALLFLGCGGTANPPGSGGAGGAGGGGSPATGGAGGSGRGGAGQGGTGGEQGPSNTSTSTSSAGAGGGAITCDALACGSMSDGCIGCAFDGPCANQAEACYHDQDCGDYQSCIGDCTKGDAMCAETCEMLHPTGAGEFEHLYECTICEHCANSCPDTSMLCTNP